MNAIRQTQQLNKRELENATPPSASWHADYRDTAWVYAGGLPFDLTEGDVVTIFSQFGNPTHLNLIRDRETGKSKGFGFLKYEDQRSCDLAVDNLTGADVLGKLLRVDHTRYKKKDDEDEDTYRIDRLEAEADGGREKRASSAEESDDERRRRKKLKRDERLTIKEHGEDEDPMQDYIKKERSDDQERRHHHRRREGRGEDKERRVRHNRDREKERHSDRRNGRYKESDEVDSDGDRRPRRRHGSEDVDKRRRRSKDADHVESDEDRGNQRTRNGDGKAKSDRKNERERPHRRYSSDDMKSRSPDQERSRRYQKQSG